MKSVMYLLFGAFVAFALHFQLFTGCENTSSPTDDNNNDADVKLIQDGAQRAEDAFASGDIEKVKKVLSIQALEIYADEYTELTPEKLKTFAVDFKNRTLDNYNINYAEFSFPWQNTRYVVQMSLDNDGTYKIMNF